MPYKVRFIHPFPDARTETLRKVFETENEAFLYSEELRKKRESKNPGSMKYVLIDIKEVKPKDKQ
ncbi:MAG: hypothetical protein K5876_01905 [Ruminiclostridium sp.]|nr:hypothetical protein [Ruminiclostridium sp.]